MTREERMLSEFIFQGGSRETGALGIYSTGFGRERIVKITWGGPSGKRFVGAWRFSREREGHGEEV
jgi:hypothetical protein